MVVLTVSGMTCSGCAASVEKIVKRADPGAVVRVDLASGRVEADTRADAAVLAAAITAAGFEARAA